MKEKAGVCFVEEKPQLRRIEDSGPAKTGEEIAPMQSMPAPRSSLLPGSNESGQTDYSLIYGVKQALLKQVLDPGDR